MTKALVVIDVQESFRARPLWQAVSNPDIVADVQRLVDVARSAGDYVVWVLHTEPTLVRCRRTTSSPVPSTH